MTIAIFFSAQVQNSGILSSNDSDTSTQENQQMSLQPARATSALLEEAVMHFHEKVSYLVAQN